MSTIDVKGKKIGLALSGGAARGLAHVGVLEVLHDEGIPVHLIAGTSAGAVMGAIYAAGQDVKVMVEQATDATWQKLGPMIDPSFPKSGFIKGEKIKKLLSSFVGGDIKFHDLKIPFACVATDIDAGEEIIIDKGPLLDALRASISVPGIFTVVKREGRYLVDGGLTTPVPVRVVSDMGADFVIAVNVNPDVSGRIGKVSRQRIEANKEPNVFQVLIQSIYITTYSLAWKSLQLADVVIEPEVAHIGASEFQKAEELVALGREKAIQLMPEIKEKLANL